MIAIGLTRIHPKTVFIFEKTSTFMMIVSRVRRFES